MCDECMEIQVTSIVSVHSHDIYIAHKYNLYTHGVVMMIILHVTCKNKILELNAESACYSDMETHTYFCCIQTTRERMMMNSMA